MKKELLKRIDAMLVIKPDYDGNFKSLDATELRINREEAEYIRFFLYEGDYEDDYVMKVMRALRG